MKVDMMIATVAESEGASYLVTANPRDFENALRLVTSSVRILRADEQNDEARQGHLALVASEAQPPAKKNA